MDDLLKTAVGLLHYCPSTDRCDLPKGIPNWYLRDVDKYHDRGRKAAIKLRDAADRIEQLEAQLAIGGSCNLHDKRIKELEAHNRASNLRELKLQAENEELETQLEAVRGLTGFSVPLAPAMEKAVWVSDIKAAIGEKGQ